MGANSSREELEISSDQEEEGENYQDVDDSDSEYKSLSPSSSAKTNTKTQTSENSSSLDDIDAKLKSLKLKYPLTSSSQIPNPNCIKNDVKLYLHIGGNTPKAKWITSKKRTSYGFVISKRFDDHESDGEEEEKEDAPWVLKVGAKVRAKVGKCEFQKRINRGWKRSFREESHEQKKKKKKKKNEFQRR